MSGKREPFTPLSDVSIHDLAEKLQPHMIRLPWPGLNDPATRERARAFAHHTGLWERLAKAIPQERPLPHFRRSQYRQFRRTGDHTAFRNNFDKHRATLDHVSLGVWLGHPAADVDYLQDLLWSWCESSFWVTPYHEERLAKKIELVSSALALRLVETVAVLKDQLESEVIERVRREVTARVLEPAMDPRQVEWWATVEHNWNLVCHGNLVGIACYLLKDSTALAAAIHPWIQRTAYAIRGFTDDGGCTEGPVYWNYGFSHYLEMAVYLQERTGGAVNLMAHPKIERISRFALAVQMDAEQRANFSDSHPGKVPAATALMINRFLTFPELYAISERFPDGTPKVNQWRGLALCNGERFDAPPVFKDHFLPELGAAVAGVETPRGRVAVFALAGSNGENHNHNDIGSIEVAIKGKKVLADAGRPTYNTETFGPRRYEILFCGSQGHSVPVINGHHQAAGADRTGTMTVEGLSSAADGQSKVISIDYTAAYPDPTLRLATRQLTLSPDGRLAIADTFQFNASPERLEEYFVTFEDVAVSEDGRRVLIGTDAAIAALTCVEGAGLFRAEVLEEESRKCGAQRALRRIAFTPQTLATEVRLVFALTPV